MESRRTERSEEEMSETIVNNMAARGGMLWFSKGEESRKIIPASGFSATTHGLGRHSLTTIMRRVIVERGNAKQVVRGRRGGTIAAARRIVTGSVGRIPILPENGSRVRTEDKTELTSPSKRCFPKICRRLSL
jgi:hypothetical protein